MKYMPARECPFRVGTRPTRRVRVRADAQRRVYEVDPAPLAALDAWLAPYRRMWSDSLDALARRLEDTETREDPA